MQAEGYIERIVFRNEENGYTVLSISESDGKRELTAVGIFPVISEGEYLRISGEVTTHSMYGEQLRVDSYEFISPPDAEATERYLASGVVKGIGAALAKRIVTRFGDDTFEIMENQPERLAEIKGISESKARQIAVSIVEKRDARRAMMFLQDYGISIQLAMKAYESFGEEIYSIMRENPYRLADELIGVGFKTADEIALRAGIRIDSEFRIRSGVLYTMQQALSQGHTCLPMPDMLAQAAYHLELPEEVVENQITDMVMRRSLVIKQKGEQAFVYAASYYYMELRVAQSLADLNIRSPLPEQELSAALERTEREGGIVLDEVQRDAVTEAANNGFLVITGGPGTGKTTTINAIIRLFALEGLDVLLAAPTGRAARRMTETTGREAQTIHRLLEINGALSGSQRESMTFSRNEENPLEADAVIVDEASMIDISLMQALVRAIAVGTRLILVGDVNQLPSVGPGNVLKDIIQSGAFHVVRLTHIFRQAKESDIVLNAHRINAGERVEPDIRSRDFVFVKRENAGNVLGATVTLVRDKLPRYVNAAASEVQVLTPMKKGALGVENLNQVLQQYLNPPSPEKREKVYGDIIFREGDKVMQVKNNYQLAWEVLNRYHIPVEQGSGVFNGDCGIIEEINLFTEQLVVVFDESRRVTYGFAQLDELEPAYAVTIHKSQGSEYPAVVLPLLSGPKLLMTRNLLYTAVTRAKKCVTIVGSVETFEEMIANETEQKRYSGLADRIMEVSELLHNGRA